MELKQQVVCENPRVKAQKEKLTKEFFDLIWNFEYNCWDANISFWNGLYEDLKELQKRIEDVDKSNQTKINFNERQIKLDN